MSSAWGAHKHEGAGETPAPHIARVTARRYAATNSIFVEYLPNRAALTHSER